MDKELLAKMLEQAAQLLRNGARADVDLARQKILCVYDAMLFNNTDSLDCSLPQASIPVVENESVQKTQTDSSAESDAEVPKSSEEVTQNPQAPSSSKNEVVSETSSDPCQEQEKSLEQENILTPISVSDSKDLSSFAGKEENEEEIAKEEILKDETPECGNTGPSEASQASEDDTQEAAKEQIREQSLFSLDEFVPHSSMRNRLISLYEGETDDAILPKNETAEAEEVVPFPDFDILDPANQNPNLIEDNDDKVFGPTAEIDVTPSSEELTFPDSIDSISEVSSLNQGITPKDRSMVISELFCGNELLYSKAVEELDSLPSLEDCIICIEEKYAWPVNSPSTRLIMSILERKFS